MLINGEVSTVLESDQEDYTPTLKSSLAGNPMTGTPVKIRNFTTKRRIFMWEKSWEESIRFSPSLISFFFLIKSNFFFLSFKVVVWLLSWRFLNLGTKAPVKGLAPTNKPGLNCKAD